MTAEAIPVRDAWDAIASRFHEFTTPVTVALGEALVERLGPDRKTRFLDVAAGTGGLAISAARRGARVLAVDISPPRWRASGRGRSARASPTSRPG